MTVKSILGPGTMLHNQIHFLASQRCNCGPKIMLMNEMGPFGCKEDFENILQWLKDATIAGGFTFVDLAARTFVTSAIDESIELYTRYDLLQILDL